LGPRSARRDSASGAPAYRAPGNPDIRGQAARNSLCDQNGSVLGNDVDERLRLKLR